MVKNQRGWTLVELMIVVAILGIMASLAPSLINVTTKFFILDRAKFDLQREARGTMYIIERELRQAQSATIAIDQAGGQPYYSRLSFTKIQGTPITITQSGTTLTMVAGNDHTTMTTNLAYIAFTFPHSDDMTIISVSMTLQKQVYGGAFKALHMASERIRVMN